MVEQEFEGIWGQVMHDIEHHGKTFEDEGTTEEDARKEYREISERRIRLGLPVGTCWRASRAFKLLRKRCRLLLLSASVSSRVRKKRFTISTATNQKRCWNCGGRSLSRRWLTTSSAKAEVTEKTVSREELFKDPDAEEAEEKPAPKKKAAAKKKPAAKKAPAKKAAGAKKAAKSDDD